MVVGTKLLRQAVVVQFEFLQARQTMERSNTSSDTVNHGETIEKLAKQPKAKKSPNKRTPREDFSQAAVRIVRESTQDKQILL
jgi:hypothetical protein